MTEEAKLESNDGVTGDAFGSSVSLSGDTALAGAPGSQAASGAAYVLVRRNAQWIQQQKLKALDVEAGDNFGFSVSLSDETALIGAPFDDDAGASSGSVYVFEKSGTVWSQRAKLTASDGAAGDEFGHSVVLAGDTALIGAHLDDDNGKDSGSAYVFTRDGSQWNQQVKLTASDGAEYDFFGNSLSLSGERALIGAKGDDDNGSHAGAAYVFMNDGSVWSEETKLKASDGAATDAFGASVALDGDTALVGASWNDDNGSAYVFERSGESWSERAKLTASDGMRSDELGYAVALEGDTALVGARQDTNANGFVAGAAYVFTSSGAAWAEQAKLIASEGQSADFFGTSVSLSGTTAVAGVPGGDGHNSDSGVAFVFVMTPVRDPTVYCTAKAGLTCGVANLRYDGSPSASATSGFVIRAEPAREGKLGLFLYTDQGRAAAAFQGGTLCLAGTVRATRAVSSGGGGACAGAFGIDWNSFAQGLLGGAPHAFLRSPGQEVHVQVWGRDSRTTGSFLSDALEYVVCD